MLELGANIRGGKTDFKVWAPWQGKLTLEIVDVGVFPLEREGDFFGASIPKNLEGACYYLLLENGERRGDPVSRYLPEGVFGPTQILDPFTFKWSDQGWENRPLVELVFYEVHIGAATREGTFEALMKRVPYFKDLGINCLELMPLGQFSGRWNWGYDGVAPYAVQNSYGDPESLKRLIDACHSHGIGCALDLVYNHVGPEGNFLADFGPYFTGRYQGEWGNMFNFDGAESHQVRDYLIQNALYWIEEFHIDALRLDAVHRIVDMSAIHFLEELTERVQHYCSQSKRLVHVLAENDLNDTRLIRKKEFCGFELSAVWNDDFHHALHVTATGEQQKYYLDFHGIKDLDKAMQKGYVYDGRYSSFRKKVQGNSTDQVTLNQFIVFSQNHDQVGNRPFGERLTDLLNMNQLKIVALLTLLSPSIPLLFMGEEYGEKHPFLYFIDFSDSKLMQKIYAARQKECENKEIPHLGEEAFLQSHLSWNISEELLGFYKELIAFRRAHLPFQGVKVFSSDSWIAWELKSVHDWWIGCFCNFGQKTELSLPFSHARGENLLFAVGHCDLKGKELTLNSQSGVIIV